MYITLSYIEEFDKREIPRSRLTATCDNSQQSRQNKTKQTKNTHLTDERNPFYEVW